MSAIRNGKSRRSMSRAAHSSPYARPTAKKSSWSITGLLSYLNPLRLRSSTDSSESLNHFDEDDESFESSAPSVASLSARAEPINTTRDTDKAFVSPPRSIPAPSTPQKLEPSRTPVHSDHLVETSSPVKNLEAVSNFLFERAGQRISTVEVEGLISLINKSTPPDYHEPFRFASSTPSTPARGNSPSTQPNGFSFNFTTPKPQTIQSTPSPRKTLTKNPNGRYRWEGGGSSRLPRSRNRYSSPAFGPSRPSNDRIVLTEAQSAAEIPKDTKRRRLGNDTSQSSGVVDGLTTNNIAGDSLNVSHRSSAPDPSPTRTSQVQGLPFPISNGPPTPNKTPNTPAGPSLSRLRPPQLSAKPTAPVIPSPLRQAWSGGSSSSQSDSPPSQVQGAQKKTKAANYMAELIKEVTPPKRPDLSNPYQTASPVGKLGPPKPRVKRVRATGKPAPPDIPEVKAKEKDQEVEKKEEKEHSPQAIIEATLPKGSKRSRPPTYPQKQSTFGPETSFSSNLPIPQQPLSKPQNTTPYIVEEVDNSEEDQLKTKRPKPHLNGRGLPSTNSNSSGITVEVTEDVDMQTVVEKPTEIIVPSIPVHSSPSTMPGTNPGKPMFASLKPTSTPKEPSKLRFSYQPETASPPSLPVSSPASVKADSSSPLSSHATTPSTVPDGGDVIKPLTPIPSQVPMPHLPSSSTSIASSTSSTDLALSAPVDSLPTFIFTVQPFVYPTSEDHVKALKEARGLPRDSLPCFEFTKPADKKATPPVKTFDWAAAGVKPPSEGTWSCSVCMVSNPATATSQCVACETPR